MDYPLTEEQIEKIMKCLSSSSVLIYGLLKDDQREALTFLIAHRFVVSATQIAINGYSNHFYKVASIPEILRQINEENNRIIEERAKAEKEAKRNTMLTKIGVIVGVLTLIVSVISLFK